MSSIIKEKTKTAIAASIPIELHRKILLFHDPSPIFSVKASIAINQKTGIRMNEVTITGVSHFIIAIFFLRGKVHNYPYCTLCQIK
jgi:hypothetical protein